jgi:putative effector of murein hydrolase LrgA (UPF0299 family)
MSEEPEAATRRAASKMIGPRSCGNLLSILGCQLADEIAQRARGVSIPGTVLGLLFLLAALMLRRGPSGDLRKVTSTRQYSTSIP